MVVERWIEVWKFPDYHVSNYGQVKDSLGNLVKVSRLNDGRDYVHLKRQGDDKLVAVYRLCVASFHNIDLDNYEVNHVDGDKTNNFIGNLEVSTREENAKHAYDKGLMSPPIVIENLDTGEIYRSATVAGFKIGYTSALKPPSTTEIFIRRGYRLRVIRNERDNSDKKS